ncbi:hypothetical protein IEQ34_016875 [Dendrobium chrysotoxum]|uniref:Uncharacterized protein n=1 Tax=Dendrobium chrysotoxum TaxID=161865 RepID=A0AAV7GEN2_DENCH|nr:hypothetical protein IEQ34_016875 [Dendrobium chrysotoxum]
MAKTELENRWSLHGATALVTGGSKGIGNVPESIEMWNQGLRFSTFEAVFSKKARDPFFSLKMRNEGNENFTA